MCNIIYYVDDSFYCEIEDIEKNSPKSNGIEKSNVIPETEAVIYSLPTDLDGEDAGISVGKMDDNISRASMASQLSDCHHENYEDSVEDMGGQDDSVYTNTIAINTKINISKLSEVIALKNASKVFHEEYKVCIRARMIQLVCPLQHSIKLQYMSKLEQLSGGFVYKIYSYASRT